MKTVQRSPSPSPRDTWWLLRGLAATVAAIAAVRPLVFWLLRRRAKPTPPAPGQEGLAQDGDADPPERRRFLRRVALGTGGIVSTLLAVPFISFLFRTPEAARARVWRRVGNVDDFIVGRTVQVTYLDAGPLPWAGFAAESAAWLRREDETRFVAFTVYCTHTGCPVRWIETADLFMCPCHGGAFYRDGRVAAGPPPVPLTRYPVRIREGAVEILTTPIPGRL